MFSRSALVVLLFVVLYLIYNHRVNVDSGGWSWQLVPAEDTPAAAHLMSGVNRDVLRVLAHVKRVYHLDETAAEVARCTSHPTGRGVELARRLLRGYNPETIRENRPGGLDTSYTVNKGDSMHVCMRNGSSLVDHNTLLFVVLHECAHIANEGWGHEQDFWVVFKWLLGHAVASGVYKPVDYGEHPVVYCGLTVDYQPLYNQGLPLVA
jgi:hypothetical protein